MWTTLPASCPAPMRHQQKQAYHVVFVPCTDLKGRQQLRGRYEGHEKGKWHYPHLSGVFSPQLSCCSGFLWLGWEEDPFPQPSEEVLRVQGHWAPWPVCKSVSGNNACYLVSCFKGDLVESSLAWALGSRPFWHSLALREDLEFSTSSRIIGKFTTRNSKTTISNQVTCFACFQRFLAWRRQNTWGWNRPKASGFRVARTQTNIFPCQGHVRNGDLQSLPWLWAKQHILS